jgi:molybdate transport system ATP-binding protein
MRTELDAEFCKRFPGGPTIEAALRLAADTFSITVVFGASGAGKTTVLRCLAGLERPDQGHVRYGGAVWFDGATGISLPPQRRGVGVVFQEYALFPHLSAAGTIAYGLGSLPAAERRRRVAEVLDLVGLAGLEGRRPGQLSGGERQRVALARALAPRPRLLLLDEPLAALDVPTRQELRRQLRRLLRELRVPALLVTHDRVEALGLGDSLVVMDGGKVCQSGAVAEVFARPASPAVARVVGIETVEPGRIIQVNDGLATVVVSDVHLTAVAGDVGVGECAVCIRADEVILETAPAWPGSARNRLVGRIRTLVGEGPLVRVGVDCGFLLTALITERSCRDMALCEGGQVTALVKAPAVHLVPRG